MYLHTENVPVNEHHAIEFIETALFTRQIKAIATDDELRELQRELIQFPNRGDVIQNTGGLRKIRLATGVQGKSGGARVIYFVATAEIIWFVLAYPKNVKDTLTNAEKAELKKLTRKLKDEV
ncbi:type II toxin-antitoxin system RelE/ParE family toxin [Scandinavium sp.]|uniref:type II toxin-antitoxin system RelE/ParE family toxin n=1 Tax=Scandinavium sp. TaxID=2830653 RepID=UPI0028A1E97D|nr:type II toxin-antitoxin system RelE/ParE family toxin [Scandinavium sp.]